MHSCFVCANYLRSKNALDLVEFLIPLVQLIMNLSSMNLRCQVKNEVWLVYDKTKGKWVEGAPISALGVEDDKNVVVVDV